MTDTNAVLNDYVLAAHGRTEWISMIRTHTRPAWGTCWSTIEIGKNLLSPKKFEFRAHASLWIFKYYRYLGRWLTERHARGKVVGCLRIRGWWVGTISTRARCVRVHAIHRRRRAAPRRCQWPVNCEKLEIGGIRFHARYTCSRPLRDYRLPVRCARKRRFVRSYYVCVYVCRFVFGNHPLRLVVFIPSFSSQQRKNLLQNIE